MSGSLTLAEPQVNLYSESGHTDALSPRPIRWKIILLTTWYFVAVLFERFWVLIELARRCFTLRTKVQVPSDKLSIFRVYKNKCPNIRRKQRFFSFGASIIMPSDYISGCRVTLDPVRIDTPITRALNTGFRRPQVRRRDWANCCVRSLVKPKICRWIKMLFGGSIHWIDIGRKYVELEEERN